MPGKGGRPTKYKPEYCQEAYKLCLLGMTDKQLAKFFEVDEATLNRWKIEHPKFRESLKDGKERSDAEVAKTLRQRALGYEVDDIKVSAKGDVIDYKRHIPGDVTACIFWLKNRRTENWRDKQEVEHSGEVHLHFDEQDKGLAGEE